MDTVRKGFAFDLKRISGDIKAQSLCHITRLNRTNLIKEQHKFLAPESAGNVARPQLIGNLRGDMFQRLVPHQMPMLIVEISEMIEIDEQRNPLSFRHF